MAMVGRPRDFRHHDIVRAFKAARAAGIDSPSLRIRTPGGTEYHFGGEVKADVPKIKGKSATPVRDSASLKKGSADSFGDLGVRAFPLAEGGKNKMLGTGDRTVTDKADAARPQASGRTGHQTSDDAKKFAKGGEV